MRTQVMPECVAGAPWLEHFPAPGGASRKTAIEEFPFSIGRNEACDLPVASNLVSREHAHIVRDGTAFRVRDLNSTNGTFVNGRRVDDALLNDGDILMIADIELSFFCKTAAMPRGNATQVMGGGEKRDGREACASLVQGVRRLHEALTHRSVATLFQGVYPLAGGAAWGYEALSQSSAEHFAPTDQRLLATECRLTGRIHQLQLLLSAEEASRVPGAACVFLNLTPSELSTEWQAESLERLRDALGPRQRLVVDVPDSAVSDIPYFREFRARLAELGIGLAYDGFAAGQGLVAQRREIAPDYLKLARQVVRDLDRSGERQAQVAAVVRACQETGCEVVATGLQTRAEAEVCRDLGCRFGQGDLYGPPRPLDDLCRESSVVSPLSFPAR